MKKILLLFSGIIFLAGCKNSAINSAPSENNLSAAEVQKTVQKFINENLAAPGKKIEIKEVVDDGALFKIKIKPQQEGQPDAEIFASKDGKKIFPQVIDMEKIAVQKKEAEKKAAEKKEQEKKELKKSAKPKVELFVMSHCPYGTQIEKGILPVLEKIGGKINFELKFCDYLMHGKKELDEQILQFCVQKNSPEKFKKYLQCFLEAGDSQKCVAENKIDEKKCVAETDKKFKISENFAKKETWKKGADGAPRFPLFEIYKNETEKYGVRGSPTLVVNEKNVSAARDPQSLLEIICAAFEKPPAECTEKLAAKVPSPGFGFSGEGKNTDAQCD